MSNRASALALVATSNLKPLDGSWCQQPECSALLHDKKEERCNNEGAIYYSACRQKTPGATRNYLMHWTGSIRSVHSTFNAVPVMRGVGHPQAKFRIVRSVKPNTSLPSNSFSTFLGLRYREDDSNISTFAIPQEMRRNTFFGKPPSTSYTLFSSQTCHGRRREQRGLGAPLRG